METRSKIISLLKNIELQEEAIADLLQIKEAKKITQLNPDEDLHIISDNLAEAQKNLKNLQREYQQRMLSRIVKGGIEDEEMARWWHNRY